MPEDGNEGTSFWDRVEEIQEERKRQKEGYSEALGEPLYVAKGYKGRILLYPDRLLLDHDHGRILTSGGKKEILIPEIITVNFREPTKIKSGFISVVQRGRQKRISSISDAGDDENSILVHTSKQVKMMSEMVQILSALKKEYEKAAKRQKLKEQKSMKEAFAEALAEEVVEAWMEEEGASTTDTDE